MNDRVLYDRTQPIRDWSLSKQYTFDNGLIVRQLLGDNWQAVSMGGKHLAYMKAEDIVYADTLAAEFMKQRVGK